MKKKINKIFVIINRISLLNKLLKYNIIYRKFLIINPYRF